jgi:hypothetical protein
MPVAVAVAVLEVLVRTVTGTERLGVCTVVMEKAITGTPAATKRTVEAVAAAITPTHMAMAAVTAGTVL